MIQTLLWSLPGALLAAQCFAQKLPLERIKLPPGFQIAVFAQVPNARSMAQDRKSTRLNSSHT